MEKVVENRDCLFDAVMSFLIGGGLVLAAAAIMICCGIFTALAVSLSLLSWCVVTVTHKIIEVLYQVFAYAFSIFFTIFFKQKKGN